MCLWEYLVDPMAIATITLWALDARSGQRVSTDNHLGCFVGLIVCLGISIGQDEEDAELISLSTLPYRKALKPTSTVYTSVQKPIKPTKKAAKKRKPAAKGRKEEDVEEEYPPLKKKKGEKAIK